MAQVEVIFNGEKISVDSQTTILGIAESKGVKIPTLCHDKHLDPYGSCFVCVAEVVGARTLLPACATKVRDGMEIKTNSELVMSSRKTAFDLLLSNHYGDCYGPCKLACPAECDAQGYTALISRGQYKDAMRVVKDTIPLPASIGRVCPRFCEDECRRARVEEPIAIGDLKRFMSDMDLETDNPYLPDCKPKIGKKAAVVGGGPAGLAAAFYLIREGVDVEIFEAKPVLGGMLYYGIPSYRLPKDVLAAEIKTVTSLGIKVNLNKTLGKDFTIDELKKKYDAVVLGFGAWNPMALGAPGEDAEGVLEGIKFLEKIADKEPVKLDGKVAIIGGGNTAFDCARSAMRLGAKEVVMVYRRTRKEMPANEVEKIEAEEEGIIFEILTAPLEVLTKDGKAVGMKCQRMELGEPDASGRRRPVPIKGSEFEMKFDYIITAIGQRPDLSVLGPYKETISDGKWISYDQSTGRTKDEKIFIAGDLATGAATVVEAFAGGKKSALAVVQYVKGEEVKARNEFVSKRDNLEKLGDDYFAEYEKADRQQKKVMDADKRKKIFDEIEGVFTEKQAQTEANRCLECGCMDVFECKLKEYGEEYECRQEQYAGDLNTPQADTSSPFIAREPDKCVLCGRCIRLCDQKVQLGVFGYVDRGFITSVAPEFKRPMAESDCIACGTCIEACPVGALVPKTPDLKNVPLTGEKTDAYCYHCSIGCENSIETVTDSVFNMYARGEYLCTKGRFHFPDITAAGGKSDLAKLKKFTGATVYPSPSLSCEDYEVLKQTAGKMDWELANYYSRSSLWQAFAGKGALPSMDFFTSPLEGKTAVVLAGAIEQINPVALNRLADIILDDTAVFALTKQGGKRLERFQAHVLHSPDSLEQTLFSTYDKVVLVINPVDVDDVFGFGSSLEIYNNLASYCTSLSTTLLSEARNIYSFYDAHKGEAAKKEREIYISTTDDNKGSTEEQLSLRLYEKGKQVAVIPYKLSYQVSKSFLNSKNVFYKNNGIFKENSKCLSTILAETAGVSTECSLKQIEVQKEGKIDIQVKKADFPEDSFIKHYSRKKFK